MRFVKFRSAGSFHSNKVDLQIFSRSFFFPGSSQRGGWESANANIDGRRGHPAEGHRRVYLIILLRRDLLADEIRAHPMVVRQPSRALHGAAGSSGFRKVVLR